ncbi:MAG: serine/threonine-protein kinase [Pseudomonadota bacterium]
MQTESRWERLQSLFEAALDLTPSQRDPFLTEACGADVEMRDELRALLAADETGGESVRKLIAAAADSALTDDDAHQNIGPYRLVREIGSGGMGTVHLAERSDAEYEQRVAIKLLHRSMVAPEFLARFRSERQILADLNHPNIAHLIDGGTTQDGIPYLVMEYVEGTPIHQYCDDQRLNVHERLELFCRLCAAIEVAHQNLIVHRDIKPTNVLVTPEGMPKLLDFGIAKSLGAARADQAVTQLGDRILTPNHASPEQVMGRPASTGSDIYSMGVLLYELLCGAGPFNLTGFTPAEMERIVTVVEADPPSVMLGRPANETPSKGRARCPDSRAVAIDRNTTPERLRRLLSGDLDNIVLKAIHKDRDRRYRSVGHLAEDIRRHLDGMPVTARPDRFSYRAAKFIRRNRWGVAAASAFIVSLGAFAAITYLQANRLASKNASLDSLVELLIDTFEPADPYSAATVMESAVGKDKELPSEGQLDFEQAYAAEQFLDQAASRLLAASGRYTELEFTRLQHVVALMYYKMGRYDDASSLLLSALQVRESRLGRSAGELTEILVLLSTVDWFTGEYEGACQHARRALDVAVRTQRPPSSVLALAQGNLANIARQLNQSSAGVCDVSPADSSEALLREALANHDALGPSELASSTWRHYGNMLNTPTRAAEALEAGDRALAIDVSVFGSRHRNVAVDQSIRAIALMNLRRHDDARRAIDVAIDIHDERLRMRPSIQRQSMLRAYWIRGQLNEKQGRYEDALADYRVSHELALDAFGEQNADTGKALHGMAASLVRLDRPDEAESYFVSAIDAFAADKSISVGFQATLRNDYGELLTTLARTDEARSVYREALDMMGVSQPHASEAQSAGWVVGVLLSGLGAVETQACDLPLAQTLLKNAVVILERTLPDFPQTTEARQRLAAAKDDACERRQRAASR